MNATSSKTSKLSDLKSPKGNLLLGNLKDFNKKNKHYILEEWAEQYGDFYTIKLGPKRVLVISDVDTNSYILKQRPHKFRRFSKIDEIFVEMGFHNVFNAEGESWKKQRKPVMEALNVRKVKGYYPIIEEKTKNLISKITTYTNTEKPVEILQDFIAYTIDVTTEVAFGYKLNTIQNKEDSFQKHLELIFPLINERITAPIPIWRVLPNSTDRKLKKSLVAIEKVIYNFIDDAKKSLEENPELRETPATFLQALLIESEKEDTVFSEKILYGNVVAMLIAGEDTTSNTMAWTLFFLAQNPEMVALIREEANNNYESDVPETYSQVAGLKYTNGAVQESLRLKPTTPFQYTEPNEDVVLNDILVPKGTLIIAQTRYAALQNDNFSDAMAFNPSRWIKGECPYQHHAPKTVKTFGGGPRLCPGMHLSMIEMTAAISSICKNFDLSLGVDSKTVEENFAFTVSPENLKVIFKKPNM